MERREFLKSATQGVAAWTALSAGRVMGANDRLHIGLIGCGGRGTFDCRLMRGTPEDIQAVAPENYHNGNLDPRLKEARNVDVSALCDVYGTRVDAAKKWAPEAKTYNDFRKLLADKDIDAVIVATPDPWHASIMVLACEAGKDVYVEKPVMYRVGEAHAMVNAVRRTKRIVQVGTQHRSADHIAEAARMIQSGKIGEVHFVRIWNYMGTAWGNRPVAGQRSARRPKLGFLAGAFAQGAVQPQPAQLPVVHGLHQRHHQRLRQPPLRFPAPDHGRGYAARRAIPPPRASTRTLAGDIYDMQTAIYEYPNFILNYEACNYNGHGLGGRTEGMRYYGMRGPEDRPHGMAFYGTEASLFVDRIGMELYSEPKPPAGGGRGRRGSFTWEPRMEKIKVNEDEPTPLHTKNFVDSVRSRKEPFANIEVGVRATAVACMGNVAYWTGRKLKWDGEAFNFGNDKEANTHAFRPYRKPWDLVKFA